MEYIKNIEIKSVIFYIIFLVSLTNGQFMTNPQLIMELEEPILVEENGNPIIYYPEYSIYRNITTRQNIIIKVPFCNYTAPYVIIRNKETNQPLYIYSMNTNYFLPFTASFDSTRGCVGQLVPSFQFSESVTYLDYIQESHFDPKNFYEQENNEELTGCRCKVLEDEIIIYGKKESSKLSFNFLSKNETQIITICDFEDYLSCHKVDHSLYMCAVTCNNKVTVFYYTFRTKKNKNSTYCGFYEAYHKDITLFQSHTELRMFDTAKQEIKLLCAKDINTFMMECLLINYDYNEYEIAEEELREIATDFFVNITVKENYCNISLEYEDLAFSFQTEKNNSKYCVFKESIENEYLFCCGGEGAITCARISYDYNYIDSFKLNINGMNTHLDFIVDSNTIILYYLNDYQYYYDYYIILPSCPTNPISISIVPLESYTGYLINLVKRQINNDYYVEFTQLPFDYGNFTVDGVIIDSFYEEKILVQNYSQKYEFTSLNEQSVADFKINYLISILTFSTECEINLDILKCYRSCKTCTRSEQESDQKHHHCKIGSCQDGFYLDPAIFTNCWEFTDAESNWYLDYNTNRFFYCSPLCAKCDGPNDNDCLSCRSNTTLKYLYERKCYTGCPAGYYADKTDDYFVCEPCFETCATCSTKGDSTNMNCNKCKENTISLNSNCFFIQNSTEKTFYIPPGTNHGISSCYQKYEHYIYENETKCFRPMPSTKYYLSNERTGVLSPCNPLCLTCSDGGTTQNPNCILCLNETLNYYLGNCIENCPDGYYSLAKSETNQKKRCVACYAKCAKCSAGQNFVSGNLINMNCITCKTGTTEDPSAGIYIYHDGNCYEIEEYSNEKITFKAINRLTSETLTCLDFNLVIFNGEYICVNKSLNTYYVLDNEENTGVVEYCNIACASCHGAPNDQTTNCINCSDGYYKTEDSETNCILETDILPNYYKNTEDNIYYKCYQRCQTCLRVLDSLANMDNMGCESCISNYYLEYQTNNCYNDTFLEEHIDYYLDSDNQFHKCYFSCKRCSGGESGGNHNCIECKEGFYFQEGTNNCFNMSYLEQGFYFDNFTINLETELPVFKRCYINCKTCNNYITDDGMNCLTCINDYYILINTTNCITDITNNGYYLKDNIAYPCEENCLTCSNGQTIIDEYDINKNNIDNNNNTITTITNNCLSCDASKQLFLVENLNNCETEDFANNGFYLKEESDGTKIFHKCYKFCATCDIGKTIDPITNKDIHNCDRCIDNYYKKRDDENPNNCYGDEMIRERYRLARGFWQECHENCNTCSERTTYTDETMTVIRSQNCIDCYPGYYFIYQTHDCVNETYLEKGYFFDDVNEVYKECHISCKSCEKDSNQLDPKCLSCNNDKGYYNAEKKPASRCYREENIEAEYVLADRYDENGNVYKKWSLCYETCNLCTGYGTPEEQGCLTCISNHFLIHNGSNCVTMEYGTNNGYYFNTTSSEFYECDNSCKNCFGPPIDEDTNCRECKNEDGFYPMEDYPDTICYNNETVGEGYFLNTINIGNYYWSKCYETCATCQYKGSQKSNRCLSCRNNLLNNLGNIIYFVLVNGNCYESCPDGLYLTKEGDCVSNCPVGTLYFVLDYNRSCVEFCPELYVISQDGKKCELPEFQAYIDQNEFKLLISENISSFANSSKIIDLDNMKAQITYSDEINEEFLIKNKITSISNIENTLSTLRSIYSLPENEKLIIAIIESKPNSQNSNLSSNNKKNKNKDNNIISLGKDVELIIYDKSGRELELSYCKDEEITINKYIGDLPYINLDRGKDLNQKGIDIFDESDPFYNDICFPFSTNFSSDIPLADRRQDLFINISFCDKGCTYNGTDYELMRVKCICKIDLINDDNENEKNGIILNKNNDKNNFTQKLSDTNLNLIKCSNLVFDPEILKSNVGFYLTLSMFAFEIISFGVFLGSGLTPIKNFMMIFQAGANVAHPPKLKNLLYLNDKNNNNNENNKDDEVQKTILINKLLNKNKKRVSQSNIRKNKEGDDALVIKYSENDNDGSESNRKSLNNIDNKNKNIMNEDEKISKSDLSDDDSEKEEKKTRLSRMYANRKKTDKRNNLVLAKENVKEKPSYFKETKNKNHPMDNLDNLSYYKKNEKNKNKASNKNKNITKNDTENNFISSESEDQKNYSKNKENEDNEKKTYATKKNKLKYKEKESRDKDKDRETIVPYRSQNRKLVTSMVKPKNNKESNKSYSFTKEEFSIMTYEEAIKNDKRTMSNMYWNYVIENNFILNTFVSDSFVDLKSLKINLLCFRLELIFVFNALFYTDTYISYSYKNNGSYGFFNSLPKVFYSLLVSIFVTIFFKLLSSDKTEIFRAIKERDDKIEYNDLVNIVLKKFKIKLIIFFILQFIFSFIFMYYVTAFCSVYQNTRIYWLFGCLETIAIDMVFTLVYSIAIAAFRFYGIKKRSKCYYYFAKLLNIIF